MIIYFNPECSKCNEALGLLNGAGCEVRIRNYIQDPPTVEELAELTQKLGCRPLDLVRKKEELYLTRFSSRQMNDEDTLRMLSENPALIERPIVISGTKALIGRPPSLVLEFVEAGNMGSV